MSSSDIFNYIQQKEFQEKSKREWNTFLCGDDINKILAAQQKEKILSK